MFFCTFKSVIKRFFIKHAFNFIPNYFYIYIYRYITFLRKVFTLLHRIMSEEHTTLSVYKKTRKRLDSKRAKGQSFDGFLNELMDVYEEGEA